MSVSEEKNRFGIQSITEIKKAVSENIPPNTRISKTSIWRQFSQFLLIRDYKLEKHTPAEELAKIMEDYAYNMKKLNGEDYKESSIKSIWNTTAQMLQEKYYQEFNIKIDPFTDIVFKSARLAKDLKRKQLQGKQEKRKESSKALTTQELLYMIKIHDEDTPDGLQKKIFHLFSFELAWRGNEAVNCKVHYFQQELDLKGEFTGRIEYNPIFSKTTQGGAKALASSKWLVRNNTNKDLCPIRLFLKLFEKRNTNPEITSDRLFLTVHSNWKKGIWYKNMPIGINSMSKWTKLSAEKIGVNTKKFKVTNHSHRSSTISALAKNGVGEQEMIKLTGHSHANSLKPYLQLDSEHHLKLIENLRKKAPDQVISSNQNQSNNAQTFNYHNCNFYINK